MAHSDGQWRIISVAMTNLFDEPDVGAIVLNGRDVTERHALEQELDHQAFHDTLTGLANRALFVDRLSHAMDRSDREDNPVAVLFLDLDDFKTVNDSFGHPAGDKLLVEVANAFARRPGRVNGGAIRRRRVRRTGEAGSMPSSAQEIARTDHRRAEPDFRVLTNDVAMRPSIGIAIAD